MCAEGGRILPLPITYSLGRYQPVPYVEQRHSVDLFCQPFFNCIAVLDRCELIMRVGSLNDRSSAYRYGVLNL